MTRIWTDERITDAMILKWEEFSQKHPGISNYNGWKGARTLGRAQQALDDATDSLSFIVEGEGFGTFASTPQQLLEEDNYIQGIDLDTPSTTAPVDLPPYEVRANGDIFINRVSRTIVTNLGPEYGSATMSFDQHAAMRRRYANEWENDAETIPTIARDFDLHPRAFTRYKTLHGWTHDSDPFTDEEWQEGLSVEDAVSQTVESTRRAFHKKLQKEKWASLVKDADSWRRFNESVLTPIQAAISMFEPTKIPTLEWKETSQSPYDLVMCVTDIHFGSAGWLDETGRGYSREDARNLLIQKTQRLLSMARRYGAPSRIVTVVGSDFFHIDNYQGGTTAGTSQDLDGTPHQIVREGMELAIEQLSMLRQIAPLDIYYMGGNHDRVLGYALLCTVRAYFRNDSGVVVHESPHPRQYHKSGNTLIGFNHGDGAKLVDLPLLMATEARKLWGETTQRALFVGHLHHEVTHDIQGVLVCQNSSLCGTDRWHANKGYGNARRSMAAYIVDHEEGIVAALTAPVIESISAERK